MKTIQIQNFYGDFVYFRVAGGDVFAAAPGPGEIRIPIATKGLLELSLGREFDTNLSDWAIASLGPLQRITVTLGERVIFE